MVDVEGVKKMLRAVLLANKGGVSLSRLQLEYKELTGEQIPHKQMGHNHLDALLASMPSVVRTERTRSGEVCVCVCTAHLAKVVARQRSSKKTGRPHLVNTQMRVKPAAPLVLNAKPQTSLRQPNHRGRGGARGGGRAPLNPNESLNSGKEKPYNPQEVQRRISEILGKYSNGFWVSKLPQIYRELYKQDMPTEAFKDLETWIHICTVEKTCSSNPSELLLYPAKEQTSTSSPPPILNPNSPSAPGPNSSTPTDQPVQSPTQRTPSIPHLTHSGSCSPRTTTSSSSSPSPPSSPGTLSPDLKLKLEELLVKYSNGLWAHALPKLFQDTLVCLICLKIYIYSILFISKFKFPGHVLENLHLLSGICTIDYPMPDNPKRAILEELGRRLSNHAVPSLQIPKEEYPSVLVVEATNTNGVIIRYIGEGYSLAQESMEDEMRVFYDVNQRRPTPLSSPSSGQLVAVRAEEEEEILRGQVCEVMADRIKVHYVDHGFSEVISKTKVLELHERFFKLPFQATKCKLAGLEPFCQEPAVLKRFETMASGKILLAEIIDRGQPPVAVLYDTSQDDDVNINSACMKALQDKTLTSTLQVNSAYMNVTVRSVCSDGTIYCQLPSRGLAKLNETLENIEAYFHSQVTSEFLVSNPFCGKVCVARYKGKWSRVEITNLHGRRVLDILFIDVGVQASVEVFELREIPPQFLRDLMAIPPQAVKCCLADLAVSVGSWTPDAVQWLREKVLNITDCSMKVAKVDETKRCTYVHLFTDKNFHDAARSLNHQMGQSDLFRQQPDVFLTSKTNSGNLLRPFCSLENPCSRIRLCVLLGNNIDVYVSVACHPGHFVLQPWRDMYRLVVLMGEMILYYSKTEEKPLAHIEKNHIYAAKIENSWHRVLVKGVLSNGSVSVYELDYGKHELVSCTQLRPLIKEFRQLPFQGITAQLAGLKPRQWSEEASIVFRNHVEKKPLVAQLEAVQEATNPWDRKLVVFLVDTSQEERDIWVHDIMAEFADEPTNKP
uniref:Tudor domain containing 7 b n=1 Tax=Gasterosteus aculeatus aculeatus TaxID=481459 RepID=A0AAQ4QCS6_GASAC